MNKKVSSEKKKLKHLWSTISHYIRRANYSLTSNHYSKKKTTYADGNPTPSAKMVVGIKPVNVFSNIILLFRFCHH
jgi:hypothetical protein